MQIDVISIFPDYLAPLQLSVIGRAIDSGLLSVSISDLRDFTSDPHRTVDDSPYGGGPGMVMKPEPWGLAIDAALAGQASSDPLLVIPSPSGVAFTQRTAEDWASEEHLIFACGRYEGIDSRVADEYRGRLRVVEASIGDYVLAGGEAAVLVMVEAVARLLPGVLGNEESAADDSFGRDREGGQLEGPLYTRPREWRGHEVPEVVLSGDHGRIRRWRVEQAELRTRQNRPDLVQERHHRA